MASLASVPSPLGSARALSPSRVSSRARTFVPARRGRSAVAPRAASISVQEARELLFGDDATNFVYLDVRTPKEFGEQHAVGAVNIPVADMTPNGPQPVPGFVAAVNERFPGKKERFVVGCLSGARSEKAIELLRADGWPAQNLLDLTGGFRKYNQEFTPDGKPRAKPGGWKDTGPITWTDS